MPGLGPCHTLKEGDCRFQNDLGVDACIKEGEKRQDCGENISALNSHASSLANLQAA